MPKQGQFAKATRLKQLNNFKTKRHQGKGNIINANQFTDYLVVRFALTAKKRVSKPAQETTQRLLIEIADRLVGMHGDLAKLIPEIINRLNSQVPWQFFKQVTDNWELLQNFLVKEVPAVPLADRVRISNQVALNDLNRLVATALAEKGAATTLLNQAKSNPTKQRQTTKLLLLAIYRERQVDWSKVAALLSPLPYQPDPSLDRATRDWLIALSKNSLTDF